MMKLIVLSALAVLFTLVVVGAVMGSGGGEHRFDENCWDDDGD